MKNSRKKVTVQLCRAVIFGIIEYRSRPRGEKTDRKMAAKFVEVVDTRGGNFSSSYVRRLVDLFICRSVRNVLRALGGRNSSPFG